MYALAELEVAALLDRLNNPTKDAEWRRRWWESQ